MRNSLRWALIACAGLVGCAVLGGAAAVGRQHLAEKKLGYCFDAAFDQTTRRLFFAGGAARLHLLDVSEGMLRYISTYHDGGYARNLQLSNGRAYVAATHHGLIAIDVSDPTDPTVASIYPLAPDSWAEGLAVRDGLLYLAVGNQRDREENRLHILGGHDPYTISTLGKLPFPGWVEGVDSAGDVAYVANTWSGARAVDIGEPDHPLLIDSFTLRRWMTRHLRSGLRLD